LLIGSLLRSQTVAALSGERIRTANLVGRFSSDLGFWGEAGGRDSTRDEPVGSIPLGGLKPHSAPADAPAQRLHRVDDIAGGGPPLRVGERRFRADAEELNRRGL